MKKNINKTILLTIIVLLSFLNISTTYANDNLWEGVFRSGYCGDSENGVSFRMSIYEDLTCYKVSFHYKATTKWHQVGDYSVPYADAEIYEYQYMLEGKQYDGSHITIYSPIMDLTVNTETQYLGNNNFACISLYRRLKNASPTLTITSPTPNSPLQGRQAHRKGAV